MRTPRSRGDLLARPCPPYTRTTFCPLPPPHPPPSPLSLLRLPLRSQTLRQAPRPASAPAAARRRVPWRAQAPMGALSTPGSHPPFPFSPLSPPPTYLPPPHPRPPFPPSPSLPNTQPPLPVSDHHLPARPWAGASGPRPGVPARALRPALRRQSRPARPGRREARLSPVE